VRILAVMLDGPPRRFIGSELATLAALRFLADRGHDVEIRAVQAPNGSTWTFDGLRFVGGRRRLAKETADVVITHVEMFSMLPQKAAPSVAIVHNARESTVAASQRFNWSLVVFNSHATADEFNVRAPSVILHPPVDYRRWQVDRTGAEAITMVNVTWEKGSEVFWECAERMPDHRFIGVVGGWGEPDIRELPNVEIVPHGADMLDVYRRTRVLLMPSEHESWGRVAVEAMSSGAPVVATDLPGVREAVGAGGALVERDWFDEFERQLRRLDDPTVYATISDAASARAVELDPLPELEAFAAAVESLVAQEVPA
jgi:glycosyltransferase involved in cell wall biosynthesis